jgi:nitroreductase
LGDSGWKYNRTLSYNGVRFFYGENSMKLFEAIIKRHCYRGGYKEIPVPREDLEKIVQAGLDAPTGKNAQTTEFVIVDDPQLVSRIAALHPMNKAVQQGRAFIACICDRKPELVYEGLEFQVEDCAAATENMLLAITALGYSSVWIDGWLRREGRADVIGQMLSLPPEKYIRILLPVGIASEEYKSPAKKPFAERAWFNGYKKA